MEILRILGIGIIAAVLSLLIKQHRPELAIAIPILGGAAIFLCSIPYLRAVVEMFGKLAEQAGLRNQYLRLILKMIGVAYLCQFSAELCRDAGEASIAGKIELGGKLLILVLSMPVVYQLLGLIEAIINF